MQRLILIILSTFFFIATPAFAKGSEAAMWIVSQRSGDARVIRSGLQPAALQANAALAPGDIVTTGATGRATLERGSDYIVVAPRSELRLPSTPQPSGFTRVIQTLGTMLFKVRHTGTPHFAVDTPMLAAVVKGTTFTIVVDKDRSAVQVIEGAVQVIATDGGMHGLVEGGRTVFIDRANPKRLITADSRTLGATETSTESSVKINGSDGEPLAAVAELTSGLVRADVNPVARTESPVAVNAAVATVAPADDNAVQPGLAPVVSDAATASPTAAAPAVSAAVTVPAVTLPAVTVPAVTVPAVTLPAVTVPAVTVPAVTLPPVTLVPVALPTVTVPAVTVPAVTVPTITVPAVTVPTVTAPTITVPTVPTVTVPTITAPTLPIVTPVLRGLGF